jgi:hypothetical protein
MQAKASWIDAPGATADLTLWRRLAVRALHAASRWLDARAYWLQFPEPAAVSAIASTDHLEVAQDPETGFAALYVNGERRFTFLQGIERL